MKVSRSTTRPRRLGRHRSSGPWVGVVSLLIIAGAGTYLGSELGWWSSKNAEVPQKGVKSGGRGLEANRAETRSFDTAQAPAASAKPASPAAPPSPPPSPPAGAHESVVPSGAPITIPRFGKQFEDALARGAFKEAESALAMIGGAADAERRLETAMEAARARIAARFSEIARTSGERAARVYVTHQLANFPDRAEARNALQALLAQPENPPSEGVYVAVTSRPATRESDPGRPEASTDLLAMKEEATRVLDSGEVATALSVLREVASAAEAARDQAVMLDARRLIRQGEAELRLRRAIIDKVTKNPSGDRVVPHLPGEKGQILGATDEGITFTSAKGQVTLKWRVLPIHSLSAIIHVLELSPSDMADAAATLYRAGNATEADALLAKALKGSGDIKRVVDQTLADARGMSLPPEGFRLVEDKWLSPQEVSRHEIARDIAQSTKDLAVADPAARRAAFTRMLKLGDVAKSPLHRALLVRRAEIRDELQKAPVYAKLADLGARRRELDEGRAHALELIEDEVRYPYPYRPPEATAEQFKAYSEAQREIDIRVAKLRTLWNQQLVVTLPKPFKDKVALLVEVGTFLTELGAAAVEPDPAWLTFLPAGDEVTLQTVATSEYDRKRIDESAEVMKSNATRQTKATKGELDQARITNDYRVMFGRAAVMVHDQLTMAAHGHCEDMARLGFFAHSSPVPGKTSPLDRVRATGMRPLGASENIAQAGGPSGAHEGWCHSSGHHRNLLAAGWKLLGVGNSGHLWCQNFAAGEEKPLEEGGEGQ